jgi:hypothetical protein
MEIKLYIKEVDTGNMYAVRKIEYDKKFPVRNVDGGIIRYQMRLIVECDFGKDDYKCYQFVEEFDNSAILFSEDEKGNLIKIF